MILKVSCLNLASETVLGVAYWSLFHGLGPMIWFYPLNELDITGYEAFVSVVYTPLFLILAKESMFRSKLFFNGCLLLLLGKLLLSI